MVSTTTLKDQREILWRMSSSTTVAYVKNANPQLRSSNVTLKSLAASLSICGNLCIVQRPAVGPGTANLPSTLDLVKRNSTKEKILKQRIDSTYLKSDHCFCPPSPAPAVPPNNFIQCSWSAGCPHPPNPFLGVFPNAFEGINVSLVSFKWNSLRSPYRLAMITFWFFASWRPFSIPI